MDIDETITTSLEQEDYDKVNGKRYDDKEIKEGILEEYTFNEKRALGFIHASFYLLGELDKNQKGLNSVYNFRNVMVALKFCEAVKLLTGNSYELAFSSPHDKRKSRKFVVELPEKVTLSILERLGIITVNAKSGKITNINNHLPKFDFGKQTKESDGGVDAETVDFNSGFFTMLYLEAGKLTSYDDYKLEIQFENVEQSEELFLSLTENNLNNGHLEEQQKIIFRNNSISEFFALCRADKVALNLSNYYFNKSLNGNIARKENFKIANLDKTLTAAAAQLVAIMNIRSSGKFNLMSSELRELAEAREHNSEASIQTIAEMVGISKSTAYHRMERIIDFAKEVNANG